ncbi:elongator complex protein 1 [Acrodontium crateriforme]|uniref:Elongator complex protein 1 n=1 Tax=Acrodontium crateriforme TaxID=150365 RepID=A0AAQ3M0N0_9PEZI|nr:elongator complex protein 1 [Acrodontium crateriforme]
MRNLRNIAYQAVEFPDAPFTATAFDLDDVICAFGPSDSSPAISLKRFHKDDTAFENGQTITSWDAPSPNPELAVDRIISLHCFSDTKNHALVLEGGDIVVVREEPQDGEDTIEIVGTVDAGILAAAWSPDEELLAISTKADTLLFMTRDFEGIANVSVSPDDLKVSNHVSVGWGKKETQFKGRGAAKALRDPTVPEHIDEGTLSSLDTGKVSISWRGDGQYVATNSVLDGELKRRVIRVYTREGVLESVSEPINGLDGALSWKPSGQTIASIQRQSASIDVVFFERNGLRHGEFSLRLSKDECDTIGKDIALAWNVDSTVLAVSLNDRVQLWTTGNYHWYLKQEIRVKTDPTLSGPVNVNWHLEKPLHLTVGSSLQLCKMTFTFTVTTGSIVSPFDGGLVAVIDGRKLKVTPLRTANIPPPMGFDEVELPEVAVDVAFSKTGTELAVLHSDKITVWTCDYGVKPVQKAKISRTLIVDQHTAEGTETSFWRQIAITVDLKHETIVHGLADTHGVSRLASFHEKTEVAFSSFDASIISIFNGIGHGALYAEDKSGTILEIGLDETKTPVNELPVSCADVQVWKSAQQTASTFGLTSGGILHGVHGDSQKLRIPGCTSFIITANHLIYTTSQHLLKFVHLHEGELEIPLDEPEKDERCRNVERGAKLVTVMPGAYSLILQMPRGNLETIYPRALVLAAIRANVTNREYKKAFIICRTHRVDFNILHDYAPEQFIGDIDLFVKQVKKTEYVDLFLSSLAEENVAETIYKETLNTKSNTNGAIDSAKPVTATNVSKINRVCDAFLAGFSNSSSKLQNVITAHVCKNPPDLEAGLSLVSKLREEKRQEQLDQAVEHICFLADVNQLYDTALGLYDLDVALLVAQQSQKDPREYLPYLQRLHDLTPLRRSFEIDNDLKRYSKALSHLHSLDAFDELKEYCTKHELYSSAIDLYRYDNTRMHELMRLHADFLSSRNKYKEAGIAYEFIGDQRSAYEAYRAASMWQECLAAAALVPVTNSELEALAEDLANSLEENKKFSAAARIHLDYLNDLDSAVKLMCKSYHFAEAIRAVAMSKKPDLLKSLLDPGLIEASASITELLAEMKSQLAAQVPRVRELRLKKAEDPMAFLDGAEGADGDIPDNISLAPTEASTTGTFMTRYTNRSTGTLATNATHKTSRNRRREERKRARGKKGTVYEEEYLVNSISRLIERLNSVGDEISQLVEGLMRRGMRERAVAVESAMREVERFSRDCIAEVFTQQQQPQSVESQGQQADQTNVERPWGGEGVLWEAIASAGQKKEAPVLKAFERLSLL